MPPVVPTPRAQRVSDADVEELKELREQTGWLKRLLAEAELEQDALRETSTNFSATNQPSSVRKSPDRTGA